MATAKLVNPKRIPPPPPSTVHLELTMAEAAVLEQIVGGIIGDVAGPRGLTNKIFYALTNAGVPRSNHKITLPARQFEGRPYLRLERADSE